MYIYRVVTRRLTDETGARVPISAELTSDKLFGALDVLHGEAEDDQVLAEAPAPLRR